MPQEPSTHSTHLNATATHHRATTDATPIEICPQCETELQPTADHSKPYCQSCGYISNNASIDYSPWHTTITTEGETRTGSALTELYHDKGLRTHLTDTQYDAAGELLSERKQLQMRRLRKQNKQSKFNSKKERNIGIANNEIQRMAAALGLPQDVTETACVIFRKASENDIIEGRSVEQIATAALCIGARCQQTPRLLDEFSPVAKVNTSKLKGGISTIQRELNVNALPPTADDIIERYGSTLSFSEPIITEAFSIYHSADNWVQGHKPNNVAAAALYASTLRHQKYATKTEIASAANANRRSMTKIYSNLLADHPDIDLTATQIKDTHHEKLRSHPEIKIANSR